jgi:hypothetical protein
MVTAYLQNCYNFVCLFEVIEGVMDVDVELISECDHNDSSIVVVN